MKKNVHVQYIYIVYSVNDDVTQVYRVNRELKGKEESRTSTLLSTLPPLKASFEVIHTVSRLDRCLESATRQVLCEQDWNGLKRVYVRACVL